MEVIKVKTNECKVVVEPRYVGNYGCFSIGGMSRTPKDEYSVCQDIVDDIKRHVDDVGYIDIEQKVTYKIEEKDPDSETLAEALLYKFVPDEYDERWIKVRGKYRESEEYCSSTYVNTFKELIEWAYNHPYDFEVCEKDVNDIERIIVDRVIEFRKK